MPVMDYKTQDAPWLWDHPKLLLRLANSLIVIAMIVLAYTLVWLLIYSPLFPVRHIQIHDELRHLSHEQLLAVIRNELRGTFFTIDLDHIRHRLELLPWVRSASIRRHWPDTLDVHLEEHIPYARLRAGGLVNQYGEHIHAASNAVLPILDGPDHTEALLVRTYQALKDAFSAIQKKPTRLWLSERRAWQLELDHQMIVKLGREHNMERVKRFILAYPQLMAQLGNKIPINVLDLRYANGFAVVLAPSHPAEASKQHVFFKDNGSD